MCPVVRLLVLVMVSMLVVLTGVVTNDDLIDDDVDPVMRDADDTDVLPATPVEVPPGDVITRSRDVSRDVETLRGDVTAPDDLWLVLVLLLLLSLFTVDVSCSVFVNAVMVTSLPGDADNCTELLRSLLDC